jgi:acyl-CoA reductase-like NAD-dependent aldehyde dehydrogenase
LTPIPSLVFTGAAGVGRVVVEAAAKHRTPVTLELAGKSPCIVDQHVDPRVAARRIVHGTVLRDVSPGSRVMEEEIFGPILPVLPVDSMDHAMSFVKDRPKPLSIYAFSRDRKSAQRLIEQADQANDPSSSASWTRNAGGAKRSPCFLASARQRSVNFREPT